MKVDIDQISAIIKSNPNKKLIQAARDYSAKLSLHVLGHKLDEAFTKNDYFESQDIFDVRHKHATSNKDLFGRLLQREEMVFTAKGGASFYNGLSEAQITAFDAKLDKIRFNITIRKWIKEFALQAYRTDPMGVLFVEVDADDNSYPTYKSTDCIFDYKTNGRKLEYVCFRLTGVEAKTFLIAAGKDASDSSFDSTNYGMYYRFVDDDQDRIVKVGGVNVDVIDEVPIQFDTVPGIVVSDIIDFTNVKNFLSPLDKTIELANTFLQDRSIRDLSKKYSGFPKGYEPLMTCENCKGTGMLSGKSCQQCTPAGSDKGTGFKLRTKVSDIARFPLPKEGQNNSFDPSKFYGYISPDIAIWDKQDTSLNDIEGIINDTYWGTTNKQSTTGPTTTDKHAFKETATKTLADLKPIYTRLNITADWAESTENALCNFIGEQFIGPSFKSSARTYGRNYILETPDELIEMYLDMKTKGAPQTALFDVLEKYYNAVYEDNPIQLTIKLKLMNVEPFIHMSLIEVQGANPSRDDFYMKMYYGEWISTLQDTYILTTTKEKLIEALRVFAKAKMVLPADSLIPPVVSVSEARRQVN